MNAQGATVPKRDSSREAIATQYYQVVASGHESLLQSTTLKYMPESSRQPCHCPTCNGATVALRTRQRHASRLPPTSILSFPAWSQQCGTAFTGEPLNSSLDSDNDNVDQSPDSSQRDTEYSRPSKRFRVSESTSVFSAVASASHDTLLRSGNAAYSSLYALYIQTKCELQAQRCDISAWLIIYAHISHSSTPELSTLSFRT